jgi:hypothetical protein
VEVEDQPSVNEHAIISAPWDPPNAQIRDPEQVGLASNSVNASTDMSNRDFSPAAAVDDMRYLVGLDKQLHLIEKWLSLEERSDIGVIRILAERKFGKTSAFASVISQLKNHPDFLVAEIALHYANDWKDFVSRLTERLSVAGLPVADNPASTSANLLWYRIEEALRHPAAVEKTLIIGLDEIDQAYIDGIVRSRGKIEKDRIEELFENMLEFIEYAKRHPRCCFLITFTTKTARNADFYQRFNFVEPFVDHTVDLGPLEETDMRKLVDMARRTRFGRTLQWDEAAVDRIVELSTGSPFLAKLFLFPIINLERVDGVLLKEQQVVTYDHIDILHTVTIPQRWREIFEPILESHFTEEEFALFWEAAQAGYLPEIYAESTSTKELKRRHYLIETDDGSVVPQPIWAAILATMSHRPGHEQILRRLQEETARRRFELTHPPKVGVEMSGPQPKLILHRYPNELIEGKIDLQRLEFTTQQQQIFTVLCSVGLGVTATRDQIAKELARLHFGREVPQKLDNFADEKGWENSINSHIKRMRDDIVKMLLGLGYDQQSGVELSGEIYIQTVRGRGYRLNEIYVECHDAAND